MSTTGTGASFTPGTGEQYATPKAFKIKKSKEEGINSPFDDSSPSIPGIFSRSIFEYLTLINEYHVHHWGNDDKTFVPCVAIIGTHSSIQKYNTKK